MKKLRKSPVFKKLILFALIFFTLLAFNFQDSRTGGWYLQIISDLGSRQISDITFTDSLTGYAVAQLSYDTNYIMKTTNGGDNWQIVYKQFYAMTKIHFLNNTTGFVCGGYFYKTTNAGFNWNQVNTPAISSVSMFIISNDSIWLADPELLTGGLFRTTNGGVSWDKLDNGIFGSSYPDKIYFINSRIGFASNGLLFRTTNSGYNWSQVQDNNGFNDMVFYDSLIGYKTYDSIRKTTNGGLNWTAQRRPILNSWNSFYKFALINKDTIWGVGGAITTPNGGRGIVYKTTNGGLNWGYQIPDTAINIWYYDKINFYGKKNVWAYAWNKGIHTISGGNDTTFYTSVNNISTKISKEFILYQNYPNPFNPLTNIKYKITNNLPRQVKLKVFNVLGKEISVLVNKKQTSGIYEIKFDGSNFSSGIYFYSLFADGIRADTKKMIIIK